MSVDSEERDIRLNVPIPANIQPGDTLSITFTAETPDEDYPDLARRAGIIGSLGERDLPTEREYDLAIRCLDRHDGTAGCESCEKIMDRFEEQLDSYAETTPQYSSDTAPVADYHGRRRRWSDLVLGNPEYMPRRKSDSVRGNLDPETGALKPKECCKDD